ncbi:hypothetical protein [Phenylobacterium sp.]|uniref:hypothetical protein n=1 Tax=Phenylobacterium sp. TaxID=1871053 RepID=UPI0035B406B7
MSGSNRHQTAAARGLSLLAAAAILFAGSAWIWNLGATRIALAQRGYPVSAPDCSGSKPCKQDTYIAARTAASADTALYIALGQLVASLLGLGGVGYTVFYARLAWREAERSANAAHEALEDTRNETAEQAARFESQLKAATEAAEASRSGAVEMGRVADAMSASVEVVRENFEMLKQRTAQQMRAYVTVLGGTALFQDRNRNIRFEGRPLFLNTGATPAHKLQYRASCAVIDVGANPDFRFPLDGCEFRGAATLNSQQNVTGHVTLQDFIPDQDVIPTMSAAPRAFVVWGVVTYEDIFEEVHETRFGIVYYWTPNIDPNGPPIVQNHYTKKHNEAT